MTRKDYVKLAKVVREASVCRSHCEDHNCTDKQDVIDFFKLELSQVLAADNPRFDRERFYWACDPEGSEK